MITDVVDTAPLSRRVLPTAAAGGNATAALAIATVVATLVPVGPVAQVAAVVGVLLVCGSFLASFLKMPNASPLTRILVSVGAGYLVFVLVGALLGSVLTHLGDARPLDRPTLLVSWSLVLVGVAAANLVRGTDPLRDLARSLKRRDLRWCALLALPPLLAVVGALQVNRGDVVPAFLATFIALACVLFAVFMPPREGAPPRAALLASALLTLTWQTPLRGGWLVGFDTQHEYFIGQRAISQGSFPLHNLSDPYGGMLSLTTWPAQLHGLANIDLRTTLLFAPEIFIVLALLATWSALREWCTPRVSAVLCALFIIGCNPTIQELPQITRQCYALFFFAMLVWAIASRRLPVSTRRWIAAGAGLGIGVTHYSSAYLAAVAVFVGGLLTLAGRHPRSQRVLNLPVTAVVVGAAFIWGGLVARSSNSVSQVLTAISKNGFHFLPGSGNVLARWINAASVGKLVSASTIRHLDVGARASYYKWMKVTPTNIPHLVNDPAPASKGIPEVGVLLSAALGIMGEVLLLASILAVVVGIWRWRRDAAGVGLAGMGAVFVVVSAVSRLSQTIGVDFSPSRVEIQAYVLFAVIVGVELQRHPLGARLRSLASQRHQVALVLTTGASILAVLASSQLLTFVIKGAQLPVGLSTTGEQAQRLVTPQDIIAAKWVDANRPAKDLVQSDRIGQTALWAFGFNDRPKFIASVDPIIVSDFSWVYAYSANVRAGVARGGNNAETGVFRFPTAFFESTRNILYVSASDVVYGQLPARSVPAKPSVTADP